MDFDGAIAAHVEWKTKIRAYLMKRDGSFNASLVSQDNQCALGKWIYGEGAKYSSIPEFALLKMEHARFHECTGRIIAFIDAGKLKDAETMLLAGSEFMKLSGKCVSLILQVKQKAVK